MKLAFLFPGQGSQKEDMLHYLPKHPVVDEVIQQASILLNESVFNLDSREALTSTLSVQLSLLVSSVAVSKLLESEGITPDFVAGHSVGAFSAAVTAKVIGFPDALKLVKLRGELMEKAYPSSYGMGVITGLSEKEIKKIIATYSTKDSSVYVANLNSPCQTTVSGSIIGIKKTLHYAKENGAKRADLLNVKVPSHSPLLQSVSAVLYEALRKVHFQHPVIPYSCNRTARLLRSSGDIRDDLAFSLSHPVKWHDATSLLYEHGTRLFIEMNPGNVLTKLARKAFPQARAVSVEEDGLENTSVLAQRFFEQR
ncbi:malonate decarboxylase epsilon subunit [Bacillus pakistanensis]|uniref:Malonyl CoA-acyl carrier protein transacylase n=1 Tax=Rossellomorea pakistanensis TaxID=992288 RepID=A0ABS2NC15_9BACI|nr:malonate decarboxylase subunit epsilon [Bacillus pakistanensis]MBM7585387.1 malonate decarboxylase epsilon subunit [Bacillus pakistanensis]